MILVQFSYMVNCKERIHMERKLLPFVIHLLDESQQKYIYTSDLIQKLTKQLNPTDRWKRILKNRNDTHFSQIVRNLVCHRDKITNAIHHGPLYYDPINKFIFKK